MHTYIPWNELKALKEIRRKQSLNHSRLNEKAGLLNETRVLADFKELQE